MEREMIDNFEKCLAFTLAAEGGFVDDPVDPKNMGITLAGLRQWEYGDLNVDALQVKELDVESAAAIYGTCYWNPTRCDALAAGVDLMVFDFAVGAGPRRSIVALQHALDVPANGFIGYETLRAAAMCEPGQLVAQLENVQLAYYRMLYSSAFKKVWAARRRARVAAAQTMVSTVNGHPQPEKSRL